MKIAPAECTLPSKLLMAATIGFVLTANCNLTALAQTWPANCVTTVMQDPPPASGCSCSGGVTSGDCGTYYNPVASWAACEGWPAGWNGCTSGTSKHVWDEAPCQPEWNWWGVAQCALAAGTCVTTCAGCALSEGLATPACAVCLMACGSGVVACRWCNLNTCPAPGSAAWIFRTDQPADGSSGTCGS